MNPQKHYQNDKLQKSSILFLQLGLVLALFFVYGALEFETLKKTIKPPVADFVEPPIELIPDKFFTIKRKADKPIEKQPQTKPAEKFIKVPDKQPDFEDVIKPTDPEESDINKQIEFLPGGEVLEPEKDEVIPFPILEDAPIFPGCEGLEKEASKKCFTKGLTKFVNKKFNSGLAESLNLSGKQKIWVKFKVDKTGSIVDIEARAPHKKLEKEAIRVIEKLPQMTPGKQRKRPVGVKYTLPIVFHIY